MNDKELSGRERLKEALEQYDKEFFDQFPVEEEKFYFSKKHRKKMNRILRRAQFPWMRRLGMIGKYVAIIAIVLFITCNNDILTYGESKFTSEFYSYTTEGRPNVVWYCFPIEDIAKAPKTIETLFEVTYIPEGYELVEHQVSIYKYKNNTYRYENADGDYILFQQNALSRGVGFQLPHWTLEEVQYQDIMILYAVHEKQTTIYWGNYGYSFKLSFSDSLPKEECMKIFDSIQKVRERR